MAGSSIDSNKYLNVPRHGLNGDLGFSAQNRKESIRRVGHASKVFNEFFDD